jgi:hypothetical protein
MANLGDVLECTLEGNALDKLFAEGLETLLCCSSHDVYFVILKAIE